MSEGLRRRKTEGRKETTIPCGSKEGMAPKTGLVSMSEAFIPYRVSSACPWKSSSLILATSGLSR